MNSEDVAFVWVDEEQCKYYVQLKKSSVSSFSSEKKQIKSNVPQINCFPCNSSLGLYFFCFN